MSSSCPSVSPPNGIQLQQTLRGHDGLVTRVAWSFDGNSLASPSFDGTIRLWRLGEAEPYRILSGQMGRVGAVAWSPDGWAIASAASDHRTRIWSTETSAYQEFDDHSDTCLSVAWSPDGRKFASGGGLRDRTIHIRSTVTWNDSQRLIGHAGAIHGLAWSPDSQCLASCSSDGTIRLWDVETGQSRQVLKGHTAEVHCVAWSPDGRILASASDDNTIWLWDTHTGITQFILEGHTASVNSVAFSFDGTLLASKSSDETVRLWRYDHGQTTGSCKLVGILTEPTTKSMRFGLSFHPTAAFLATLGDEDTAIRIWRIDTETLATVEVDSTVEYYKNARVVLVGDSGVGKSGLGLVLSNHAFEPTESTHGRQIWKLDSQDVEMDDGRQERREVLLWDLAGQPGYRLIHQLHLKEIAVALVVFDAQSELDPFAGVRYWHRALRQAQNLQSVSILPMKKFLVSARIDRGVLGVSPSRISTLQQELAFEIYFETSAKENRNIADLRRAILAAIDWSKLPKVVSTDLFHQIKLFLINMKQSRLQLAEINNLFYSFCQQTQTQSENLYEQFLTCVELVESRDLIRRLSFGNFLLLQPELLDAYASAIVNEAKSNPDGLGGVFEEDILAVRFNMPKDERIQDKEVERLLLHATIEELLKREIALREKTDEGTLLLFPSQFTRELPELPVLEGVSAIFEFEGAVQSIYATLAVRLARSRIFTTYEMWKSAVLYQSVMSGTCGILLRSVDDGKAELTVFFSFEVQQKTRLEFEGFIYQHLQDHAPFESILRRRIYACSGCKTAFTEAQVTGRRARGFSTIRCSACDTEVSLLAPEECLIHDLPAEIPNMNKAADTERDRETALSVLRGKQEIDDFDVFLSYNSQDKDSVAMIAELLKQKGLNPWFDINEIQLGQLFQERLEEGICRAKVGAVFIGTRGIGKYQYREVQALQNQSVKVGIPVIPILLPGVVEIPEKQIFLRQHSWIKLEQIDDPKAITALVRVISETRRS